MSSLTFETWEGHDNIQENIIKKLPICRLCKSRIFGKVCNCCKNKEDKDRRNRE